MRRSIVILIAIASTTLSAADHSNKIASLLVQNSQGTELSWQNKNLNNDDLNNYTTSHEYVKTLDLSDNSFTGEFPLQQCLTIFPNLEVLKVNNNRINGFALEFRYKNSKLRELLAENTDCVHVDLCPFYNAALEVLDLSGSKQLSKFTGFLFGKYDPKKNKVLNVHLRNVVIPEKNLSVYRQRGIMDTRVAAKIKEIGIFGPYFFGGIVQLTDCALRGNYCIQHPIPFDQNNDSTRVFAAMFANASLWSLGAAIVASSVGYGIGSTITYCCLPNHGKVEAIKFITGSADESQV